MIGPLDEVIVLSEQKIVLQFFPRAPGQEIPHSPCLHWSRDPFYVRWHGACMMHTRRETFWFFVVARASHAFPILASLLNETLSLIHI